MIIKFSATSALNSVPRERGEKSIISIQVQLYLIVNSQLGSCKCIVLSKLS